MNIIYYIEVNLICIIILLLLNSRLCFKSEQRSTEKKVFHLLVTTTIIFCVADLVAGVLRGQFFAGARIWIHLTNLIYFEALTIVSFLWMLFVFIRLKKVKSLREDRKSVV